MIGAWEHSVLCRLLLNSRAKMPWNKAPMWPAAAPQPVKRSWQNIMTYHTFTQLFHNTWRKQIRSRQLRDEVGSRPVKNQLIFCGYKIYTTYCSPCCGAAYNFSLLIQIDADDVITRDEQIYVLIGAHAKCERKIKAQIALVKGKCAAEWSL